MRPHTMRINDINELKEIIIATDQWKDHDGESLYVFYGFYAFQNRKMNQPFQVFFEKSVTDGRKEGRTEGWETDGWKDRRTVGQMDGQMNGRTDGWTDRRTDGR